MKKAKLVYGKSYIFGFFFFVMKNSLIPLSFPSHSSFSQILLIPFSFPSFGFPSFPSFGFPSFPCHSPIIPQFIRFPLIPLSFHCHLVSPHSPVIPLIRFLKFPCHSPHSPGFPLIRFPLLHTQFSLGSLSLPLFSLGSLSPFPCSLKKQDNITDSRGKGQEG